MGIPADLEEGARRALELGTHARVVWMQSDHWVLTPESAIAFGWMEYLLRSERCLRPRCLQILGGVGMGKTALLAQFAQAHPVQTSVDPLRSIRPVLLADALAGKEGVLGLRTAIIGAAWPAAVKFDRFTASEGVLDSTLRTQRVRMILIDEAGELLRNGKSTHKNLLRELRRISQRFQINLVTATVEGLDHVFDLDAQLKSRFSKVVRLEPWVESEELRAFLRGYERYLPFPERSFLDAKEVVQGVLLMTQGVTKEIIQLIQDASLLAIEQGASCLTLEIMQEAHSSVVPPAIGVMKRA